jgi:hypothetical protein
MKLVLVMLGLIMFLLSYAFPMAVLPAALADSFGTPAGVITAIAYTALYALALWWLWGVFKGVSITNPPPE